MGADNEGSGKSSPGLPRIPRQPGTDNAQKPDRTAVERYTGPGITGSGSPHDLAMTNSASPAAGDPPMLNESNTPVITPATSPGEAQSTDGSSWIASGNVQDREENEEQNDGQAFQPALISYW